MLLTWDKSTDDETPVDHGIGEENKPAVAAAGLELATGLGATHTSGWVFTWYLLLVGSGDETCVLLESLPPIPIPT